MLDRRPQKYLFLVLCVAGFGACFAWYLHGVSLMWDANRHWDDPGAQNQRYDQSFYFNRAHGMWLTAQPDFEWTFPFPPRVIRSRMPGYPWILHFFFDDESDVLDQFNRFKIVNTVLSCMGLAAIGYLACHRLGLALGAPILLITAFTVFVFKAILIQPEITYFVVFFGLFVLMVRCLNRPQPVWALATGVLAGLAHFLKGSGLPMVLLFLCLAVVVAAREWWRGGKGRRRWQPALAPVLFVAGFAAVAGKFVYTTWEAYGSPFYDPNGRYYLWIESPDEMKALQQVYLADRKPAIDADNYQDEYVRKYLPRWEPDPARRKVLLDTAAAGGSTLLEGEWNILPRAGYYFGTHSAGEALDRLWRGLFTDSGLLYLNRKHPNGYFKYVDIFFAGMIVALALCFAFRRIEFWNALKKYWIPILFVAGTIAGNLLLYSWWAQISNRNRFFLTLYLPILMGMGWVIHWGYGQLKSERLEGKLPEKAMRWLPGFLGRMPVGKVFAAIFLAVVWFNIAGDILAISELRDPEVAAKNLKQ